MEVDDPFPLDKADKVTACSLPIAIDVPFDFGNSSELNVVDTVFQFQLSCFHRLDITTGNNPPVTARNPNLFFLKACNVVATNEKRYMAVKQQ